MEDFDGLGLENDTLQDSVSRCLNGDPGYVVPDYSDLFNCDDDFKFDDINQDGPSMGDHIFTELDKGANVPDVQTPPHSRSATGSSIASSSAVKEDFAGPVDPALYQNDQQQTVPDQNSPISSLLLNSGVPPAFQQQLNTTPMQPAGQQLQPVYPSPKAQVNNAAMMPPQNYHYGQVHPDNDWTANWAFWPQLNPGPHPSLMPTAVPPGYALQPGHCLDNPRPTTNSHQPSYHYPLDGIEGNSSAYYVPQHAPSPRPRPQPQGQPIPNPTELAQCKLCACRPHTGPCPPYSSIHAATRAPQPVRPSPPKRKWSDTDDEEDDYGNEPPPKARKISEKKNRHTIAKRGQKVEASEMYGVFHEPGLSWVSPNGFRFKYSPEGQWDEKILLSPKALKEYVVNCPRKLVIWLQHAPAQCKTRMDPIDKMCRYKHCPLKSRTIINGWFRVVFDEFPSLTSSGKKDPFKMAGAMHLWCFEQMMDPAAFLKSKKMRPDDRILELEPGRNSKDRNIMAITRDNDTHIIEEAVLPWTNARSNIPPKERKIPFENHEHSLSYTLVKHHLGSQVHCRARSRNKRNQDRPEEERKTQDAHMGNLALYVQRDKESKARNAASRKKARPSQSTTERTQPVQLQWVDDDEPPEPSATNESPCAQKKPHAQVTPNGSTQGFDSLLNQFPVNENEFSDFSNPAPGTGPDLHQVFFEQQYGERPLPELFKALEEKATSTLRRSLRLSAGNIAEAPIQSESEIHASPDKAQNHRLPTPGNAEEEVLEEIQVAPSSAKTSSPLGYDDDLFGDDPSASNSPTKYQGSRRASGHTGDEVQGSPLRRSGRVSSKKSP